MQDVVETMDPIYDVMAEDFKLNKSKCCIIAAGELFQLSFFFFHTKKMIVICILENVDGRWFRTKTYIPMKGICTCMAIGMASNALIVPTSGDYSQPQLSRVLCSLADRVCSHAWLLPHQ